MIRQHAHLAAPQGNVHTEQAILRDMLVGVLYAHREQGPRDLLMKPAQVPWTTQQLVPCQAMGHALKCAFRRTDQQAVQAYCWSALLSTQTVSAICISSQEGLQRPTGYMMLSLATSSKWARQEFGHMQRQCRAVSRMQHCAPVL